MERQVTNQEPLAEQTNKHSESSITEGDSFEFMKAEKLGISVLAGTFQFLNLVIIGALIVTASTSVIELAARVSTQAYLEDKINSTNAQIATALTSLTAVPNNNGPTTEPTSAEEASLASAYRDASSAITRQQIENISDEIKQNRYILREFTILQDNLSALQFAGKLGGNRTVADIQREIGRVNIASDVGAFSDNASSGSDTPQGKETLNSGESNLSAFLPSAFERMRSDTLLVLAVVACGALGTAIGGLRDDLYLKGKTNSDEPTVSRTMVLRLARIGLGGAAGFIAFLALKGGKFLFVIEFADGNAPINPYAAAFAGIITGLFTERLYQLLNKLMDKAERDVLGEEKK